MIKVRDINTKLEVIEVKLDELEEEIQEIEESLKTKTDENEAIVITNEAIKEKQLVSKADLEKLQESIESSVQESQVRFMKWMIGTGVSAVIAISGIIQLI